MPSLYMHWFAAHTSKSNLLLGVAHCRSTFYSFILFRDQFVERVNGSRVLINFAIPSIFPNERREK